MPGTAAGPQPTVLLIAGRSTREFEAIRSLRHRIAYLDTQVPMRCIPWVDVPVATYYPTSTPASTCGLQGHRMPFDPVRLKTLYPDHGAYVRPFIAETERLVTQGWLTRADADVIINVAANASIPN